MRSGRKSQDEVFDEFIETFDMHHSVSDLSRRDRKITKEEFTEYYANVSSVVDEDSYFELIMTNTWRLNQDGQTKGT